jgi:hypothetical protein
MQDPKFELHLSWKPFRVYLPKAYDNIVELAGSNCCGNTASATGFKIFFLEEPQAPIKDGIFQFWNSLSELDETAKFDHEERVKVAVTKAKDNLPHMEPETMIPAERKILMGMELNAQDKGALLVKYPN